MDFLILVQYFTIYSFLGWLVETIYCSILEKRFVYRGFLNGPFCTIYGFGSILVLVLLNNWQENILVLFFMSMLITSLLEYITSYLLENIFHMKWWDYSKQPFNINGRICLWNSTLFGLLSVFLFKVIHPKINSFVNNLPGLFITIHSTFMIIYFIIDTLITSRGLLSLRYDLEKIESKIEIGFNKLHEDIHFGFIIRRMLRHYPDATSRRYSRSLKNIREQLQRRREGKV